MVEIKLCLFLLVIPYLSAFNIGLKGAKVLTGASGSMLGYSLDFAKKDSTVWLMVGSPKATDPDIGIQSGALYYCESTFNSLSNCKIISITRGIESSVPMVLNERRDEMWLGASMDVGNAFSFCGPRWMRDISDDTRTMNGLCYEVPFGFLDGDSNLFPILLNGLYNSATADQFTAPDSGNFNQTIKYGLAASGMSIKYFDKEVLVGSPGLNEFAGGFVHVKGQGYSVKAQNILEPKQGQMYGYALGVGRFYGDSNFYFVSGGPRDGGSGKVLITAADYSIQTVKERLAGVEPGSYFGSVICVIPDTKAENMMDKLLVGAPMYSNMQTYSNNFNINQEQGRVYVYSKSPSSESLEVIQTLEGSKVRGARFGSAMASLNDLNKDGFNDVVIGAPFEENGQGAVYVYMGYKRGFFQTQKISAANVATAGTTLKAFGSAFTQHPVDFNGDKHSDLAIGAYGSDNAFVFFTNPPITMTVETKTNLTLPPGQTKATIIPQNTTAFTLNVCFDYEGENIPSDVVVTFDVTADSEFLATSGSSAQRVCFKDGDSCVTKTRGSFTIFKAPAEVTCPKSTLEVMVKDDWSNIRGLFVPVVFDVEFNVTTSGNTECTVGCPVVNKFDPNNDDPFAKARKYSYELARAGCGTDNICQSDLVLSVKSTDKIVTGPEASHMLDVTVDNIGEPSYNTEILFTFNPNITLSTYDKQNKDYRVTCSPEVGGVKCTTDRLQFPQGEKIMFQVMLDARKLTPLLRSFPLKVEVKTGGSDRDITNNVFNQQMRVLTNVKATYNLIADPEVYITKPASDKPTITVFHSVQVVNMGPSNLLDKLTFTFDYPQSKLVKPMKIVLNVSSATDDTMIRCPSSSLIPEGATNQTYRAFQISIDTNKNKDDASNFNCFGGGKCTSVNCEIGTFMYDSFISVDINYEVDANLYNIINAGKDQNGGKLPNVPIVTKFTPIDSNQPNVDIQFNGNGLNTSCKVETKMMPSKPVEEDVPIWAIIVPILIAIIILVVIIVVAWKKGFFVRKYKVQMEEQKKGKGTDDEGFDDIQGDLKEPPTPLPTVQNERETSPEMTTFNAPYTEADSKPPLEEDKKPPLEDDKKEEGKEDDNMDDFEIDKAGEPDWGGLDDLMADLNLKAGRDVNSGPVVEKPPPTNSKPTGMDYADIDDDGGEETTQLLTKDQELPNAKKQEPEEEDIPDYAKVDKSRKTSVKEPLLGESSSTADDIPDYAVVNKEKKKGNS
uniref:Integrin alpha-2-like isoform X8 n=1 Tax=Crassostrea virginica TaxID=6565 RepID=A0A8B8BL73_CRAVI|nr:integrin alpha-2-like isoform X8 [Crassostrea virginica]